MIPKYALTAKLIPCDFYGFIKSRVLSQNRQKNKNIARLKSYS